MVRRVSLSETPEWGGSPQQTHMKSDSQEDMSALPRQPASWGQPLETADRVQQRREDAEPPRENEEDTITEKQERANARAMAATFLQPQAELDAQARTREDRLMGPIDPTLGRPLEWPLRPERTRSHSPSAEPRDPNASASAAVDSEEETKEAKRVALSSVVRKPTSVS